jgi:hypothetical protein
MKVTCAWVGGEVYDKGSLDLITKLGSENFTSFTNNLALNSTANIVEQDGKKVLTGAPTECALLGLLNTLKVDYTGLRAKTEVP